ncbi:AMP-binding protein [Nocardia cyriacigeorgica]|uniref:AMP-binding protein n=1 Tax=Nocardia cyriacigeorgica TaxID=135487 RepID=UPI001895E439|nr:AMP-binding protein [Nocardia cyriacigeorgica]MBF6080800.1 AMP-binding protein [Nocardia cyriacigeorgica]
MLSAASPARWRTTARQIAVLQRGGMIDVRRPDALVRKAATMRRLGPIAGGIHESARRTPDRVALIDRSGSYTYRDLDTRAQLLAARWRAAGISGDDTVAVLGRDSVRLVATMAATAWLGARLVLLNTGFGRTQMQDVCAREGVSAVVTDPELHEMTDDPTGTCLLAQPRRQGGFVLLTGGTTGTPKGAPRRVESPLAAAQFLDRVPLRREQTILLCAPLFHGTALSQFILALNLGSTLVLHGRFDAARAVAQLAEHRCDMVVLVPTMLRRILDLGPETLAGYDTSALRIVFTAGAALPPALGDRAVEAFGPVIYNFYGCTETGTATIATPEDWLAAPGTVGRAPVGITVALYGADGRRVTEPGAVGTVHVGNSIAFQGYSGGGCKAIRDGLMSTGDLGHLDAAGRLFIDGRDDDMIVSGGENVFPGEVEDLLYSHPEIAEAAVMGVPDEEFGARLAAFVVRTGPVDEPGVQEFVKAHLARFKAPRDVFFLDELPRTPTGKIDRRQLGSHYSVER